MENGIHVKKFMPIINTNIVAIIQVPVNCIIRDNNTTKAFIEKLIHINKNDMNNYNKDKIQIGKYITTNISFFDNYIVAKSKLKVHPFNGTCIIYYNNGKKYKSSQYKNGKLYGKLQEWYNNGNLIHIYNYNLDGYLEGKCDNYFYNGILKESYIYNNNKIVAAYIKGKAVQECENTKQNKVLFEVYKKFMYIHNKYREKICNFNEIYEYCCKLSIIELYYGLKGFNFPLKSIPFGKSNDHDFMLNTYINLICCIMFTYNIDFITIKTAN